MEGGENPVLENKRMLEEMYARIWRLYDRVPRGRKREAQRLIDLWHDDKIGYQELLRELEKLARGSAEREPGRAEKPRKCR